MLSNANINFSLMEWLSVTGLVQCVVILVYMVSRTQSWQNAILPILYFLLLGITFFLNFSLRLEEFQFEIRHALWLAGTAQFTLSYLLILQIARMNHMPPRKHFLALLFTPLAWGTIALLNQTNPLCEEGQNLCQEILLWMDLSGSIVGATCLLFLWLYKDLFANILFSKSGHERYWLILSLVILNTLLIGTQLAHAMEKISTADADISKIAFGLGFAYLITTVLFRIYPSPIQMAKKQSNTPRNLSVEEQRIAEKIHDLMIYDKLYHEPGFKRSDLAQELRIPENILSKIINNAFGKTLPQMLNEYRVEDAKRLLQDPEIPIKTISGEVGFNSLASFNRIFRDETGQSPSSYRNEYMEHKKKIL